MLLLLLLALLHAATTKAAPETRCLDPYGPRIATAASCDNALNNLQRFMLPYYRQETVKVGTSRTSDIRLRKHFIDDSPDHPLGTPRCGISFFWDPKYEKAVKPYPVSPDAYDVLYPSQLQSSAQRIRDQCVAGAPPRGIEHIVPNQWVLVLFEGFYLDPQSGNWTTLMANGIEIAVNASLVNPVAPSGSSASTVLENGVDKLGATFRLVLREMIKTKILLDGTE
ncbi:hypothetical protein OEA41_001348 [Lepraria neglecta]|uniref:Secreted protein n=1 Tax=Lepraria neglecta TaxID=209136 RepID=A0AAE0DLA8_9LECA|nr:hypothetical protein OEA41_001348 [Lepraria neglecta]